jgi:DNA-binding NarL/FixJ family response regulator
VVGESAAGARTIAMTREQCPDVVLLDAHLPDLGGPEVCRRMRAAVPDTVVAMLTTCTDDELVRSADACAPLDLSRSIKALPRGEATVDPKLAPACAGRGTREPQHCRRSCQPGRVSAISLV